MGPKAEFLEVPKLTPWNFIGTVLRYPKILFCAMNVPDTLRPSAQQNQKSLCSLALATFKQLLDP